VRTRRPVHGQQHQVVNVLQRHVNVFAHLEVGRWWWRVWVWSRTMCAYCITARAARLAMKNKAATVLVPLSHACLKAPSPMAHLGVVCNLINQLVSKVTGVSVQNADPAQPRDLGQVAQQCCEAAAVTAVHAVLVGVLADKGRGGETQAVGPPRGSS
jgi:hypothetical protein